MAKEPKLCTNCGEEFTPAVIEPTYNRVLRRWENEEQEMCRPCLEDNVVLDDEQEGEDVVDE